MKHLLAVGFVARMELIRIYECLCDVTRLRLLNLLAAGPLCVCHLQEVLGEPQAKTSKHLGYLKRHGLVEARWEGNWRVYRLVARPSRELRTNLTCLQDCAQEQPCFRRDRERLRRLQAKGDAWPCALPQTRLSGPARCGRRENRQQGLKINPPTSYP